MPKALKSTLVGYDNYTIYWVHIKEQNKVIQVKNLWIFKDYKSKSATKLPDYNDGTLTFQKFMLDNNNNDKEKNLQTGEGQKVNIEQLYEGWKISIKEA